MSDFWQGHERFRATIGAYHVRTSLLRTEAEAAYVASKLFELPLGMSFEAMEPVVLGLPTNQRRALGRKNWREVPVRVRA